MQLHFLDVIFAIKNRRNSNMMTLNQWWILEFRGARQNVRNWAQNKICDTSCGQYVILKGDRGPLYVISKKRPLILHML